MKKVLSVLVCLMVAVVSTAAVAQTLDGAVKAHGQAIGALKADVDGLKAGVARIEAKLDVPAGGPQAAPAPKAKQCCRMESGECKKIPCPTKKAATKKPAAPATPALAPAYRPSYRAVAADTSHQVLLMKKCSEFGTDDSGNPVCKKYTEETVDIIGGAQGLATGLTAAGERTTALEGRTTAVEAGVADVKAELEAAKPKPKPGVQAAYVASYSDLGLVHGGEGAVKYCFGRICPMAGGGLGSTGEATEYKVFGGTLVPFGPDVDGVFLAEARFRRGDVDADTVGGRAGLQLGIVGPIYFEPSLFLGDESGAFSVSGQAAAGFRF